MYGLETLDLLIPASKTTLQALLLFWIHGHPIWKRVLITRRDGRYMVLVPVYYAHDLQSRLLQ